MLQRLFFYLLYPAMILLTACQGYDFRINDKVVYTPDPLFSDFNAPDTALRTCLEQAISDESITAVQKMSSLNCSHAGIENLEGLGTFEGIKALRLSSNQIRNLVEISRLFDLEEAYLDNNQIIDPVPLTRLESLRHLDLSGNPALQCPRSGSFKQLETLILPQHCR